MKSLNRVFLMGHLGRAPELMQSKAGKPYTRLNLATHRSWGTGDDQREEITDWHSVFVWGTLAERCTANLLPGNIYMADGYRADVYLAHPVTGDIWRPEIMHIIDLRSRVLVGYRIMLHEGSYDVMFYEPKVYEDSLNISTNLRGGSPVIVNLKHLDPAEGTRLIDFVCGTAYAIDGHMMKIGESTFLFTPSSMAITAADDRASLGEEIDSERGKREVFFSR